MNFHLAIASAELFEVPLNCNFPAMIEDAIANAKSTRDLSNQDRSQILYSRMNQRPLNRQGKLTTEKEI
tara:strand:- start:223 stop:429 length:207 start_codon:yes stop_codon:yes gene_type:complete